VILKLFLVVSNFKHLVKTRQKGETGISWQFCYAGNFPSNVRQRQYCSTLPDRGDKSGKVPKLQSNINKNFATDGQIKRIRKVIFHILDVDVHYNAGSMQIPQFLLLDPFDRKKNNSVIFA